MAGNPGEEDDTDLRDDLEIDTDEEIVEEEVIEESPIEKQARLMGWHPKDEYMGPPHKWVPAEEFIRRGENILPILRENHRKLQGDFTRQGEEMRALRASQAEQAEVLKEMRDRMRTADQRGYDRARAEIEREQRAAAQSGDLEAYDNATAKLKDIEKAVPLPPPPKTTTPEVPKVAPEVEAFVRDNPWYTSDELLRLAMQEAHLVVKGDEPGLSLADNLEKAAEIVKARYPKKFGLPAPAATTPARRPQMVAAPATPARTPSGSPRKASPIDQITDPGERAQAREAFRRFKAQMGDFTEEEYMQYYNDPKADILTVRRSSRENLRGRQ